MYKSTCTPRGLLAAAAGAALLAAGAVVAGVLAPPAVAQEPVVFSSNFEDGTTQGWHTRGTTSIQASSAQASSGNFSLLATGRTAAWHGPAYDLLDILEAGARYRFELRVRLAAGTPTSNIALTMQSIPASTGQTTWQQIASIQEANSQSWATLVGEFSPSEPSFEMEFYVESTNTTASYHIDDVVVTEIEPPPGSTLPDNETGSVNLNANLNQFEGFGFSQTFGRAAWMTELTPGNQQQVLDLLLDPQIGAGFSILRLGVFGIQPQNPGGPGAPPQYVWDGWDGGQVWLAEHARNYGVDRFYASAWSAPGYMKNNGQVANGGELCGVPGAGCSQDWRQAYANYLLQFVRFYAGEGITITDLGFTNEPDLTVSYDSMRFTDAQIVNFLNVLGPTAAASEFDLNLVCCDAASWNREGQYTQAIEASSAAQWVDIHAGHSYVSPARSPLPTSKTTWMSEYALPAGTGFNTAWDAGGANSGLALANDIHDTLTQAQVNAYITWFGASRENTAAPIQLNGPNFTVSKRLWATAAYSRFIRPDSFRVQSGTSGQLLKISAFRNADGTGVVNIINNRSSQVSFNLGLTGVAAGTGVTTYRTDNQNSLDVVNQSTLTGSNLTVSLPARSLTTLVLGGQPGGGQPRDAYSQIDAASYDTQSGIQTGAANDTGGGQYVGWINNGDWIGFQDVDFGSGAGSVNARVASDTSGGNIQVRLGGPTGQLVGTCTVPGTGGWQNWQTITCPVSGASGVQDLYLVFTGGSGFLFNVNWFQFATGGPPSPPRRRRHPRRPRRRVVAPRPTQWSTSGRTGSRRT